MSVLGRIVESKRAEVAALKARGPRPSERVRAPVSLTAALRREQADPLRLLCEHKRRSPSAGALSTQLAPAERALVYARGGAAGLSVLTDGPFFDGSFAHVTEIHRALFQAGLATPVLAKEFVLDEVQIDEAFAAGADAVLLVARIVTPERLAALHAHARRRGLDALVEVYTLEEADLVRALGAWLVGINARDLDTLEMDVARAHGILASFEPETVTVHLSGLASPTDVHRIAEGPAAAALIGEALMRQDDPRQQLAALLAAT